MKRLILPLLVIKRFGLLLVVLNGCGRYSDFALPRLDPKPGAVSWSWQAHPDPVLARGATGAWDAVDVLNPAIFRTGSSWSNLYSGYDGRTWQTGMAVSADGVNWTRRGKALAPDPATWEGDYIAANGSAVAEGSRYLYWYQAGREPRIGLATSADGANWQKHGPPVMGPGPYGSWDERGVADPYVVRIEGTYYMYFLGQDRARRQRLGVAASPDGIQWTKLRTNPILELGEAGAFDETGLGEPAVWREQDSWWMLYTARDRREYRRLGLARSQDGVVWKRVTTAPVISGTQPWNSAVICDPSVVSDTGGLRVWFGGGNRPEPAENLSGQIGYGVLRLNLGQSQ